MPAVPSVYDVHDCVTTTAHHPADDTRPPEEPAISGVTVKGAPTIRAAGEIVVRTVEGKSPVFLSISRAAEVCLAMTS